MDKTFYKQGLKRLSWSVFLLLLIGLPGCFKRNPTRISALPFQYEEEGKWGLVGLDGNAIIKDEYDKQPSAVSEGMFYLENEKGKFNYYKMGKKPKRIGTDYIAVGLFREGLAPVVINNSTISFINPKGVVKFNLKSYKNQRIVKASTFSEGRAVVMTIAGKYGYIDTKGRFVIPPVYDDVSQFSDKLALVMRIKETKEQGDISEYGFVNRKGEIVVPFKRDVTYGLFADGRATIQIKDTSGKTQSGLIDRKGKIVLEPNTDLSEISGKLHNGFIAYSDGEKYGLLNRKGTKLIRPKFEMLLNLNEVCLVVRDGSYGIISYAGERIYPTIYKEIMPIDKKVFILRESKKFYFADRKGNPLNNEDFSSIIYSDYAQICLNNFYQTVALDYEQITDEETESTERYLYASDIKQLGASSYQSSNPILNIFDDKKSSAWVEDEQNEGVGVNITYTFTRPLTLKSIKITPGFDATSVKNEDLWNVYNRVKKLRLDFSDGTNTNVLFDGKIRVYDIPLKDVQTSFVKMTILETFPGSKDNETAISELTFSYIE